MRENTLKAKIRSGKTVFGVMMNIASPALVELIGHLGFDWVFIDAEHGPMDVETCEQMVRAAEITGMTPMIRMPYPEPRLINKYLDTGAMGVLVPHFNSKERVEAMVQAAKYHPMGKRGAGSGTRAADFGLRFSATEYAAWANSETMMFGILEDKEVDQNLPEMLKVPGFDGVLVGTSDLSQSLGMPGQTKHPDVLAMADRFIKQVMASDKLLCLSLRDSGSPVEDGKRLIDMGVPMICWGIRALVGRGAKELLTLKAK